jgi:hypothetical protein
MGINRFEGEPGMGFDANIPQPEDAGHEKNGLTEMETEIGHETAELQINADALAEQISQLDALPKVTEEQAKSIGERIHNFGQQCKEYYDNHRDEMHARIMILTVGVVLGAGAAYAEANNVQGNPFIDSKTMFTNISGLVVVAGEAGIRISQFASWIINKCKRRKYYEYK